MYQITKQEALKRAKEDAIGSVDFDLLDKYDLSETETSEAFYQACRKEFEEKENK